MENLAIDEDLSNGILEQISSLELRTKGKKGRVAKIKTQWLIPKLDGLNLENTICKPKNISDYPFVSKLMDLVNQDANTSGDMNACLVSCMSSKECNLRYHSDDEPVIDQGSDICTVSIGSDRNLDFIRKTSGHHGKKDIPLTPEYSVPANHHSLNVMKAGCQSYLLHRVPLEVKGALDTVCLSEKFYPKCP